jgi:small subunit ribosomal protein S1
MVDRNLLREFNVEDEDIDLAFSSLFANRTEDESDDEALDRMYVSGPGIETGKILTGVILRREGDDWLVDVGSKSEGIVPASEWEESEPPPEPGQQIEVLLEEVEDSQGVILLSRRKAKRIRDWERITSQHKEGDVVSGKVLRKIKGGLLIDIGVSVFLPASQVDIRRPNDIGDYIEKTVECVILKIDEARRNIVVSRRKLIEDQRELMKKTLLKDLKKGEIRKGIVKNIADFGAFVDLGGIDGLLHITDMSYGRVSHPSEVVHREQEIEVMILNVDLEREKIALGLKQKQPSPWEMISEKYPVGAKVMGEVVNVMTYGAFVRLEPGIEGLVHISEMSWTKRVNHPDELVKIGDQVEVVVLGINKDKQEISLGMKQTQANPWDTVAEKFPPGASVEGSVRNVTNYGAFIEIAEGIDGLLHVSDMSWTRKVSHASELLQKGDKVKCQVISVDQQRKRIALGLKQMSDDPWATTIPQKYQPGAVVTGRVTKLTNFGVFVELEPHLEGLLHISELSEQKIENPEQIVKVGDAIEVRILRVDTGDRKIGLSRKLSGPLPEPEGTDKSGGAGAPREELKGGTGSGSGPLFSMGGGGEEASPGA